MAKIGRPTHEHAVVSGTGCSSRFPYYMSTYGFHTIHGRALPIATGLKVSNPELAALGRRHWRWRWDVSSGEII